MFHNQDVSQLLITNPDEFMRLLALEPEKFSLQCAEYIDSQDSLKTLRNSFDIGATIPFAGHSLGPAFLPAKAEINQIYTLQKEQLHAGHFPETEKQGGNWFDCDIEVEALKAIQDMLGFEDLTEFVFSQAGLSTNLGNLLSTFYRPTAQDWRVGRTKICHLGSEFFSDQAIVHSVIARGIDTAVDYELFDAKAAPSAHSLTLKLQPNELGIYNSDDIIAFVKKQAHELQVLHLSDVIFSTGQRLDIPYILSELHDVLVKNNIKVGLDLAHTGGNRTINLKELKVVTYAVGCDYKHCGGTAGSGFGFYVNKAVDLKKYKPIQGWKAAESGSVFSVINDYRPEIMTTKAAWAFRTSNASPVALAPIKTFVKEMSSIGWDKLTAKSECLTRYLHALLINKLNDKIQFITPMEPKNRGAMLVFRVKGVNNVQLIEDELKRHSELGSFEVDLRKPNNIRITPHYGYTRFADIHNLVTRLEQVIDLALKAEHKIENNDRMKPLGFFPQASSALPSGNSLLTSTLK